VKLKKKKNIKKNKIYEKRKTRTFFLECTDESSTIKSKKHAL